MVSLESKLGQRTEDITKSIREDIVKEQKANVPDGDYELVTPDIPEGVEVNLEPDLPLVQWWGEFAREKGLSQNEFNSGVKAFVDNAVNSIPSQEQQMQELGDNAKQRIEAVDLWAKKNLSSSAYESVANIATSANNVKVLEEIMNLTKDDNIDTIYAEVDWWNDSGNLAFSRTGWRTVERREWKKYETN